MDTAVNISGVNILTGYYHTKSYTAGRGIFYCCIKKMTKRVQQVIFDVGFEDNDRMKILIGVLQVYTHRPVMDLQLSKR